MSSFFPSFSSASSSSSLNTLAPPSDDPHLEVIVTPSASAFYAGETFSVTITFRNTRKAPLFSAGTHTPISSSSTGEATTATTAAPRSIPPTESRASTSPIIPRRLGQIGPGIKTEPRENAEAGPSRSPGALTPTPEHVDGEGKSPYSPGANPAYRASGWPGAGQKDGEMVFRSPEAWKKKDGGEMLRGPGHARRTRSLALGKTALSPQEMVWALGGQQAPPLPTRRPPGSTQIPSHHPHSRKISIAESVSSPPLNQNSLPSSVVDSRPESRSTMSSTSIQTSSASASRSEISLNDDDADYRTSTEYTTSSRARGRPTSSLMAQSRTPSYQNAYGASFLSLSTPTLPPPLHPYIRQQEPRGTTTILWAYTHLVAQFHPSNTYIPPDPLLPLRARLLHQPVGSGSLISPSSSTTSLSASSSRWQLSFGTGTIGNATAPSLTGSLFGLAKDLVYGGAGGSLEEERKRVWNMKDLPVLETMRSLLGVDVKLKEGESRDFVYSIQLPTNLPPAHRGKAFRFSYELTISLNVALPGQGKRQKSKDISIPIRVWANVSLAHPLRVYDVLEPIIQTTDQGKVQERKPSLSAEVSDAMSRRTFSGNARRSKGNDTESSLREYAKHLLDTLDRTEPEGATPSPRLPPLSPSSVQRELSPSSPTPDIAASPVIGDSPHLDVPNGKGSRSLRAKKATFIRGDDELVDEGLEGSGEAVEVLSRHSQKASFDIAKEGDIVAVLTLIKTTYRLGESVLGVVSFNDHCSDRRVLKLSAFLESHEIIPENLLPVSANTAGRAKQPALARLHAEHHSAYAINTSRLSFSLDIPSDATPGFQLAAGPEGDTGGLEWRVRLAFLVSSPPKRHVRRKSMDEKSMNKHRHQAIHLVRVPYEEGKDKDKDYQLFQASTTISPLFPHLQDEGNERVTWNEASVEVVECEVPVRVLAGNTAFVVRPSVFVV
ncbi:Rgp1-domain-containing protein [Naematelia encephala]|uniref:Rgp1-domain-containing protein n=1 Tax=Naematelia encephala TaxID=71784 RepID=A0A1Y2BGV4_9TREE|nr:Rgp1-domain-containing protein [Naematelia encephala]